MSPNRVQEAQARTLGMDVYAPQSSQHDSSSSSVLSTTQAPWESTASASNMSVGTSNAPCATSPSKKRQRGRRVVTALACTECREKRAKVRLHCCHILSKRAATQTYRLIAYYSSL